MGILEKAQLMLEKYPLCDHCLGRQFALLGYELDNQNRGESLKTLLTMKGHQLTFTKKKSGISILRTLAANGSSVMAETILRKMRRRVKNKKPCHLCNNQFTVLPELTEKTVKKLNDYDYTTFLVGIKLPLEVEEREDEFKAEFEIQHGENIRNEFSRETGKRISKATGREVDHKKPDIVAIINPFTQKVTLQVNPLYLAGRYRKVIRGIPQSKWLCRECGGTGCSRCNMTGKMYPTSIEEIIATPILNKTRGEDAVFHSAGREDIDARMLGHGRPFVIEIKKPKKRFVDFQELKQDINRLATGKVQVLNLRPTHKEAVRKLKEGEAAEKVYKVVIEFDRNVSDEELTLLEKKLVNTVIYQQTPLRVLHRRADRTREKYIYETKIKRLTPNLAEMKVHCQGGLYIKELVTGDDGRTTPNVADIIEVKATPQDLDVLSVVMRGV